MADPKHIPPPVVLIVRDAAFRSEWMGEAPEPDFLCIGAQKGGTRWLYDQLAVHPQVWMPPIKEIHFFDRKADRPWGFVRAARELRDGLDGRSETPLKPDSARPDYRHTPADMAFLEHALSYEAGQSGLEWYAGLFAAKGSRITGDITPAYSTLDEPTVRTIAERFPRIRVIFLARDPIDRFWSQLNMRLRKDYSRRAKGALDLALWASVREVLDDPFYVKRSYPSVSVRTWRSVIPPDRFFLGFFDDLVADATALRRGICGFLGIDPDPPGGMLAADFNRKASKPKMWMSDEIRRNLLAHFEREYAEAATVLGGPAERWVQRQAARLGAEPQVST